jgi:hypothetical protein
LVDTQFIGWRTVGVQKAICASPEAIVVLIKQGLLVPKNDLPPAKEEGWVSNSEMADIYVGSSTTHKHLLEEQAESLRQSFMMEGKSTEEAARLVDTQFVGLRTIRTKTALCASPEAIVALAQQGVLLPKDNRPPPKEEGWISNNDMTSIYVGGAAAHKRLLEEQAETRRQDLVTQGKSHGEAARLVDTQFVGLRTIRGRVAAPCASPEVIVALVKQGLLVPKNDRFPAKEEGWVSNSEMMTIYVGGTAAHKRLLEEQAESLRQSFVVEGKSTEEAASLVDKHFVGWRRTVGAQRVLCASPEAIVQLEQQGLLCKRPELDLAVGADRSKKAKFCADGLLRREARAVLIMTEEHPSYPAPCMQKKARSSFDCE